MKVKSNNFIHLTKEIFSSYTQEEISDELAYEIQNKLVDFFELILTWKEN